VPATALGRVQRRSAAARELGRFSESAGAVRRPGCCKGLCGLAAEKQPSTGDARLSLFALGLCRSTERSARALATDGVGRTGAGHSGTESRAEAHVKFNLLEGSPSG